MLDIQFIRENAEQVQQKSEQKNVAIDVGQLLKLDEQRRSKLSKIEELRSQRNTQAQEGRKHKPSDDDIQAGKRLKIDIAKLEEELAKIDEQYNDLLQSVPNIMPDDTPLGGEESNKPEKTWGDATKTEGLKDHLSWGEERGLIDFERGAKVAGAKFYFLKGELVQLELAVLQLGLQLAIKHGFTPITVPHMVNSRTANGTGFLPRGEERQIYKIEGDDLNLIATAEMPITGYHTDEILDNLPLLYAGWSPAYRVEAGAYGKHSKGLYRVHQFNKLELYVFCKPEESEDWHKKLISLEEELCQTLEIPYQLVRIAAGDLGAPAYKKYDINYWSPIEGTYRELMSCSNVTDYQARRLNIRYRSADGKTSFVHTLNATAAAFSRVAIALIENHQQKDGSVKVPEALQVFMGGKKVL